MAVDLEALQSDAEHLQNVLQNIHNYLTGVNSSISSINGQVQDIMTKENIDKYNKKLELVMQASEEITSTLVDGQEQFQDNVNLLNKSIKSLNSNKNALNRIVAGSNELVNNLQALGDLQDKVNGLEQIAIKLSKINDVKNTIDNLRQNIQEILSTFNELKESIATISEFPAEIQNLQQEVINATLQQNEQNDAVLANFVNIKENFDNWSKELKNAENSLKEHIKEQISRLKVGSNANASDISAIEKLLDSTATHQLTLAGFLAEVKSIIKNFNDRIEASDADINSVADIINLALKTSSDKLEDSHSKLMDALKNSTLGIMASASNDELAAKLDVVSNEQGELLQTINDISAEQRKAFEDIKDIITSTDTNEDSSIFQSDDLYELKNSINEILEQLNSNIDKKLDSLTNGQSNEFSDILFDAFTQQSMALSGKLNDLFDRHFEALNNTLNSGQQLKNDNNSYQNSLAPKLDDFTNSIDNSLKERIDFIYDAINNSLDQKSDAISQNITNSITGEAKSINEGINTLLSSLNKENTSSANDTLSAIDNLKNSITNSLNQNNEELKEDFNVLSNQSADIINAISNLQSSLNDESSKNELLAKINDLEKRFQDIETRQDSVKNEQNTTLDTIVRQQQELKAFTRTIMLEQQRQASIIETEQPQTNLKNSFNLKPLLAGIAIGALITIAATMLTGLSHANFFSSDNNATITTEEVNSSTTDNSNKSEETSPKKDNASKPVSHLSLEDATKRKTQCRYDITALSNEINQHLKKNKDFKKADTLIDKAYHIMMYINEFRVEIAYSDQIDDKLRAQLLKVIDLESDAVEGLYQGMVDSRDGGDFRPAFRYSTASSKELSLEDDSLTKMLNPK